MNVRTLLSWLSTRLLPCLLCSQALVAAPFAYVTNSSDNTVSVIDLATNLVTGIPIPVGSKPRFDAITPDGTKVYVTNLGDNTVSVINTSTNLVVANPTVGTFPTGIAITPDGSQAYVSNTSDGTVSVIDTATDTVIGIPIPVGNSPHGIAFTPDGSKAYVCNDGSNTVSVINTSTHAVTTVGVGNDPFSVAITPDGSEAYVANKNDATVSVIDTATDTVVGLPIPVDTSPVFVAITPDGSKAYVSDDKPSTVTVINTSTKVASPIIPVGVPPSSPRAIAMTPDGSKAYVVLGGNNAVTIIDTASNSVIGSPIPVGTAPIGIAIAQLQTNIDAPKKFVGKIVRHTHSYWRKTTLSMRWKKSTSALVDHYEIFASGKLIASIPASAKLKFKIRLQPYVRDEKLSKKYLHYLSDKYRIRAVSSSGVASSLKKLKISHPIVYKRVSDTLVNQEKHILPNEFPGTPSL